jgi:hypothetical protein
MPSAPPPPPPPKQHATHTHHTACEWNAVLERHDSNPLELHFRHVMYKRKQARKNKQTWKLHIQLHILPYNVGNKISWVKNYCKVVVVARNPSSCSKSQSVYRFCGDAEGDKLLHQQHLSKLFTKRPKLLDSQQDERTVPQGKLTVLHSPSAPTPPKTQQRKNIGTVFRLIFCAFKTQC